MNYSIWAYILIMISSYTSYTISLKWYIQIWLMSYLRRWNENALHIPCLKIWRLKSNLNSCGIVNCVNIYYTVHVHRVWINVTSFNMWIPTVEPNLMSKLKEILKFQVQIPRLWHLMSSYDKMSNWILKRALLLYSRITTMRTKLNASYAKL